MHVTLLCRLQWNDFKLVLSSFLSFCQLGDLFLYKEATRTTVEGVSAALNLLKQISPLAFKKK